MSDRRGLRAREGPAGRTLYVARDEAERGSVAPFFVAFLDTDRERRWGFVCGNCDTVSTAMDAMGQLRCSGCKNFKRPDEWDAAHE